MQEIQVIYQNQVLKVVKGTTYYEIAKMLGLEDTLAAQVGNEVFSLDAKISENCEVSFLDVTSLTGYKIYQGALKFLFYVAVVELYKDVMMFLKLKYIWLQSLRKKIAFIGII